MRALVLDGRLTLRNDIPMPQPMSDEALLRLRRAGVCNTDLELIAGYKGFSGTLGHEFVAEVIQGPEMWLGQRVVGEINVGDETCDFCRRGITSQCRHRQAIGIAGRDGAFADYMTLPTRNLYHVSATISDDAAVFVEPLAAALQVIEGVHIAPRDRVVVIGLGKLGMLVAQVLRLTGADVVGVVRHEKQAAMLERWHIPSAAIEDLPTQRAQVVVDCTGNAEGFNAALDLVEPRGTIVLKSTYAGIPPADLSRIAVNEIRVVGSRCGPLAAALRLLEAGLVDVEALIDARYPFELAEQALEHAAAPGMLKVLLDF
ncbi:MAG: alcohol dehydrogenase catalytic domain-containing protein [Burkholderiales bacterium]|nr:alcohol dehydrogenase catalytic domain-containing protein [Anaerolineae bacterium]